jgi:hypothetical protein
MRTHRTVRGRVVYDRKPHLYSIRDVYRVAHAAFGRLDAKPNILAGVLFELSIAMLDKMLGLVGLNDFSTIAYLFCYKIVGWTMARITSLFGRRQAEKIALQLYSDLKPFLPPKIETV